MGMKYIVLSGITLLLGISCFLSPGTLHQMAKFLDRSILTMENRLIEKRSVRYVLGLLLLLVSFGVFRLSYLAP